MKRALFVALLATLLVTSCFFVVFADSTEVLWDWNCAGSFTGTFTAGDDSVTTLNAEGNGLIGSFRGEDQNNNPYGYNVDSVVVETSSRVFGGGVTSVLTNHTDNYGYYGPAGQGTYSEAYSSDGEAWIVKRTTSNYAGQKNCNWGFQASDQYGAEGTAFGLMHSISDGDGDGAGVQVFGYDGGAILTSMSDEMGGSSFRMGDGCGCFENNGLTATGNGLATVGGIAGNYLGGNGWTLPGGGSVDFNYNFNGGLVVDSTMVEGN